MALLKANTGIGTTNPTSALHVFGDGRVTGVVTASSFSGSGINLTGIVTSLVAGTNVTLSGSTGRVTINASGGGGGTGIGTQWVTTSAGIHTLSNVAIGTIDPQTALYLDGAIGFVNSNIRIGNNQTLSGASGSGNICMGSFSGASINSGTRNVLIGEYSNAFGFDGSYNVMIGYRGTSQGSHNIHIGEYITGGAGNNNIVIGNGDFANTYNFGLPDASKDLQLAIGVNTTGNNVSNSKYWIIGNEQFNIGIGTVNPTSKLHVVGDALITGNTILGLTNSSTPPNNSQMSFELTSNTNLRITVRGTDGILRSADITLS